LKRISLHLPDYVLFYLKFYLEGCTLTVHLNDSNSTPKPTTYGPPKSATLLTTLLSLYLSDLPHHPHNHLPLYLDDTALLSQSWRPETISRRISNAITTLLK